MPNPEQSNQDYIKKMQELSKISDKGILISLTTLTASLLGYGIAETHFKSQNPYSKAEQEHIESISRLRIFQEHNLTDKIKEEQERLSQIEQSPDYIAYQKWKHPLEEGVESMALTASVASIAGVIGFTLSKVCSLACLERTKEEYRK